MIGLSETDPKDRGGAWDDVTKTVVANSTLFSRYTLSLAYLCVSCLAFKNRSSLCKCSFHACDISGTKVNVSPEALPTEAPAFLIRASSVKSACGVRRSAGWPFIDKTHTSSSAFSS
ncbi:hypothetical protein TNCV_2397411 [Trichonephila clavipes]|uniref:Uncharacterized protein n=1 Tax=Trichonephila clavipes TaxID=2585209 RepID=A0A8X6VM76_TRICX|nr:hypothetical protein TNCV_2397411 [Trichonephila clavipes]